MTNLTEQWEKGELEEGFYYVKCPWSDEIEVRYVHNGIDEYECIVAPVPSYEEWQKVLNIDFNNEVLRLENAKLKELLYSLKCCLTSQNIEPQIRVEKSLAKIDNAIGADNEKK